LEVWHRERHEVFDCVQSGVNITSPTFFSVATSSDIEEATVECLGACQSSEKCNYWTLDLARQVCELKETKSGTATAANETTFSGESKCDLGRVEEFSCVPDFCSPSITLNSWCGHQVEIQILESDFGSAHEYIIIFVNDGYVAKCDPGRQY
jgi:hypothetical protein